MRKDVCVHYRGWKPDDECAAGIAYRQFERPGVSILRTLPCFAKNWVDCPKFQLPTPEQIEQYEADVANDIKVVTAIDAQLGEGKTEGEVSCPCGGKVLWAKPEGCGLRAKCNTCDFGAMS